MYTGTSWPWTSILGSGVITPLAAWSSTEMNVSGHQVGVPVGVIKMAVA